MINKVAIVGAGNISSTIAISLAKAGIHVIVKSRYDKNKIFSLIEPRLSKGIEKGKLSLQEKKKIIENISGTTDLSDISQVHLVIESIVDDLEKKKVLFKEMDKICSPQSIFASNTSSLSINEIASATQRQEHFIGLHFFNPADVIPLVEIVRTDSISPEVLEGIKSFITIIGKEYVIVKDSPGFIVNRLLILMLNEAINMVNEGISTVEDIDRGMQLGANHPMGPLALADYIGLDTLLTITNNLFQQFGEKYRSSQLLERMVREGKLGKKTGKGFYDYKN